MTIIFLWSSYIPLIYQLIPLLAEAKGSQEDALQRLALAAPALVESRDRRGEALAAGPLVYIVYILCIHIHMYVLNVMYWM